MAVGVRSPRVNSQRTWAGLGPLWGLPSLCGRHWAHCHDSHRDSSSEWQPRVCPGQGVLVPARRAALALAAGGTVPSPEAVGCITDSSGRMLGAPQRRQVGTRAGTADAQAGKTLVSGSPAGSSWADTQPAGRGCSAGSTPLRRTAHREPSDLSPLAGEQAVPKVTGSPVGEGPWDTACEWARPWLVP